MAIQIQSPLDARIKVVHAADGQVSRGAKILTLEFLFEIANRDHLQGLLRQHRAGGVQVSDAYLERQRRILADAEAVAVAYEAYLVRATREAEALNREGRLHELELEQYRAELAEARAKVAKMRALAGCFDDVTQYARTAHEVTQASIERRIELSNRLIADSVITSPAVGTLKVIAYEGGYVTAGQTVAVLDP